MFAEVGYAFGLLFIMLYIVVIFDVITMIGIFVKDSVDPAEYANYVLSWLKIAVLLIFSIVMVYFGIIMHVSVMTKIIEIFLGVLLAADGIAGIIIKNKFGRKKKK